ncbi:BTD-like protein [Mya arenaria]|uniref:BTD-like protein n=1 Tax=Mya arenaria TaxID=6604 RepID=A0ABY7FCH3_MYAAR|nr:BTD-like protein [Mya arenaria]
MQSNHKIKINDDNYTAMVFEFGQVLRTNICQGSLCCDADFEGGASGDMFAFGAFESCALIKCAGRTVESCGQPTKHTSTEIDKMSMGGNFSYPFQFPEVFTFGDYPKIVTRI